MFMTLVDYWYYTNDTTYNEETKAAMIWQAGPSYDFMPENQTKTEGNDDQGFWAMAALTAAETKFEDPPTGTPGWVAMAQAVFNLMVGRWDTSTCNGGLRWQIYSFNAGYNYKNSVANGCFFNIASRLARYTGNQSYADWATKIWDWEVGVNLIGGDFSVYDGSGDATNCTTVDPVRFTYNQGLFLFGSAVMYNYTNGTDIWKTRVSGLLAASSIFFIDGIMYEAACEAVNTTGNCDTDMKSFKAYFSRWMAATAQLCPWTHDTIMSYLQTSAVGAAAQCDGGTDGVTCGEHWYDNSTWDGDYGVGQQMSAMSIFQSLLIDQAPALVTNTTGGTSEGNPAAGTDSGTNNDGLVDSPVKSADKVGAGILTTLVLCILLGGIWFIVAGA